MKYVANSSGGILYFTIGIVGLMGYAVGSLDRSSSFPILRSIWARIDGATIAAAIGLVYVFLIVRQIRDQCYKEIEKFASMQEGLKREAEKKAFEASREVTKSAEALRQATAQASPTALLSTLKQVSDGLNALLKMAAEKRQRQEAEKSAAAVQQEQQSKRKNTYQTPRNDERAQAPPRGSQQTPPSKQEDRKVNTANQAVPRVQKDAAGATTRTEASTKTVAPKKSNVANLQKESSESHGAPGKEELAEATDPRPEELQKEPVLAGFLSQLKPEGAIKNDEEGQIW